MPTDRLKAAYARLGIRIAEGTREEPLPILSIGQIRKLQAVFPLRLLEPGESVDAYRHYCGAAQLVRELALISDPAVSGPGDDTEEALTAEAVGRAIAANNGTEYSED